MFTNTNPIKKNIYIYITTANVAELLMFANVKQLNMYLFMSVAHTPQY